MNNDTRLRRLWRIQKIGFGVIFILSGTDKFFDLLTYWPMYVSASFAKMLPMSAETFMHAVGVVEALVGLAILVKPTRLAADLATLWMLAISVNLVSAGLYDLAVRDVLIAIGTFGLARLATVVEPAEHGQPSAAGVDRGTLLAT